MTGADVAISRGEPLWLDIEPDTMEAKQKTFSVGYVIATVIAIVLLQSVFFAPHVENLSYSEFKTLVRKGKVSDLVLDKQVITGTLAAEGLEGLLPKEKPEELKRDGGGAHRFTTARVDDPALVARRWRSAVGAAEWLGSIRAMNRLVRIELAATNDVPARDCAPPAPRNTSFIGSRPRISPIV